MNHTTSTTELPCTNTRRAQQRGNAESFRRECALGLAILCPCVRHEKRKKERVKQQAESESPHGIACSSDTKSVSNSKARKSDERDSAEDLIQFPSTSSHEEVNTKNETKIQVAARNKFETRRGWARVTRFAVRR